MNASDEGEAMLTATPETRQGGVRAARRTRSTPRPIRLLVVDDHPAVRKSLVRLFAAEPDLEVIAVSATALTAVRQADREWIDVAVVDFHLGGRNGLWVTRALKQLPRPPRVVIYSAYANDHLAASCIVAGVDAMLNKGGLGSELCDAIRAVARGRRVLPAVPESLARMLCHRLNDDELPIFGMLLAGISRNEIRATLDLSWAELASRQETILNKLEALPGEEGDWRVGVRLVELEQLIPQPRADAGLSM